jgi:hypothetical protein
MLVQILQTPIILNFFRQITFLCNNISITFNEKNYTLQEILDTLSPITSLLYNPDNQKLYCNSIINFRFYTVLDRNYILSILGFNNYLDLINMKDLIISIDSSAKYSINTEFNNIIEVKLSNNNITENHYIDAGFFSNSNIIDLNTNLTNITSINFYNIFTKEIVYSINDVIITTGNNNNKFFYLKK